MAHPARRLMAMLLVGALAALSPGRLALAEDPPAPTPAEVTAEPGLTLTGRLEPADVHGYQLFVQAGDLSIRPEGPIPPMLVELRSATGATRRVDRLGDPAAPSDTLTLRNIPAGEYTLALAPLAGAQGDYRLTVIAPAITAGDALPGFKGWGDGMRWLRAAGVARWNLVPQEPAAGIPADWTATLRVAPHLEVSRTGLPGDLTLDTAMLAEGLHAAALTVRNGGSYFTRSLQLLADNRDAFRDVAPSHWARTEVEIAVELGLARGYPDGRFRPDQAVTRAELVKFLVTAIGLVVQQPAQPSFRDVKPGDWFYATVETARAAGMVQGETDGSGRPPAFAPNRPVSRAEAAVMLARALQLTLPGQPDLPFWDRETMPAWARPAVTAVVQAGLMAGFPDNRFGAGEPVTRAQAATIAVRITN